MNRGRLGVLRLGEVLINKTSDVNKIYKPGLNRPGFVVLYSTCISEG